MGALISLFAWAKGIPLRDWLGAIALGAIIVFVLWWDHRERQIGRDESAAQITTLNGQLADAQSANRSNADAIKALQSANHQCESGREADREAQATALKDRDAVAAKLNKDAAAARATLQALLAGRCKDWAQQPACGVTP